MRTNITNNNPIVKKFRICYGTEIQEGQYILFKPLKTIVLLKKIMGPNCVVDMHEVGTRTLKLETITSLVITASENPYSKTDEAFSLRVQLNEEDFGKAILMIGKFVEFELPLTKKECLEMKIDLTFLLKYLVP